MGLYLASKVQLVFKKKMDYASRKYLPLKSWFSDAVYTLQVLLVIYCWQGLDFLLVTWMMQWWSQLYWQLSEM